MKKFILYFAAFFLTIAASAQGNCNLQFTLSENGGVITGTNNSTGGAYYEWYVTDPNWNSQIVTGTNLMYSATITGNYYVCLYGYDSTQQFCDSLCQTIYVNAGTGCQASFTSLNQGTNGASFTNTSSGTYDGAYWDFGDGNTSSQTNPTHSYTNGGLYLVCLTIWSNDSTCYDTYCDSLYIQGQGQNCSAGFFAIPDSMGCGVYFNNTSTQGLQYDWSFGDGTTSTTQNPYHVYSQPGTYTVCLTAWTQNPWCADTVCSTVTVNCGGGTPCVADFSSSIFQNDAWFTNTSTGSADNYSWNFGDGFTSTAQNPSHYYAQPGTYTVCLTIWSSQDSTCYDTHCEVVTIVGANCNLQFSLSENGGVITGTNNSTGADYYEWYVYDPNWNSQLISGTNLSYNATISGTYYICLYGYDSTQQFCDSVCQSINVNLGGGNPCIASFYAYGDSTGQSTAVGFVNNSAGNYDGVFWDFGDGNYSTDPNPNHSYAQAGTYIVCLTIWTNDSTCYDTYCDTVSTLLGSFNSGNFLLGVEDTPTLEELNIYPNPVVNDVNLEFTMNKPTDVVVSVFNTYGQVIEQQTLYTNNGINRLTINTNSWSKGIYLLNITSTESNQSFTERIVKQ